MCRYSMCTLFLYELHQDVPYTGQRRGHCQQASKRGKELSSSSTICIHMHPLQSLTLIHTYTVNFKVLGCMCQFSTPVHKVLQRGGTQHPDGRPSTIKLTVHCCTFCSYFQFMLKYALNINHLDLTFPLPSLFFIKLVLLVILNYYNSLVSLVQSFSQEASNIHQQLRGLTSQVHELKGLILEMKEHNYFHSGSKNVKKREINGVLIQTMSILAQKRLQYTLLFNELFPILFIFFILIL